MSMQILDLRYLVACADAGRFTVAARALGLETSTVSRRIGNLEDELGLSLFERDHAGIRLTRGGREVLSHAQRVLTELDAMKRIGRQIALGKAGEIRLGIRVPPVGGSARVLLTAWRKAYPDVAVTVVEGNERELALGLSEHRLDAALVAGNMMWPRVTARTLFREEIMAALPAEHRLAHRAELDWQSLSNETILVQGSADNHAPLEFYASVLGNDAHFHEHVASKQVIMSLVGAGLGVTLATSGQAEVNYPGVIFKRIAEENARIEFCLIWLPEIEDPIIGRFVAFMRDESRARGFV